MLIFNSGNEEPSEVEQDMEVEVREGVNDQHGENHPSDEVNADTTQLLPIRLKRPIPVGEVALSMILPTGPNKC